MFYVYVIQNDFNNKHYIGSTSNIENRLSEHNQGRVKSTKNKGKWRLIYSEEYKTNTEARIRENKIKSYKGGNAFKKLIAGLVHR